MASATPTYQNKHQSYDLAQMQSVSLSGKIAMTKQRIRQWYEYFDGNVALSFSGGKDSTVLKHIIDEMYDDVPSVFVNTGLEYPEIQRFAMSQKNVVTLRPDMRFDEVVKKVGYPIISKEIAAKIASAKNGAKWANAYLNGSVTDRNGNKSKFNIEQWKFILDSDFKVSDSCCDIMKKKPLHKYQKETGRMPIVATMACESLRRKVAWMRYGCNAFDAKNQISKPMSFWTEQDVLHYIKKYDVPYCSVYGDIKVKEQKETMEGQVNLLDLLGCYGEKDQLETTGCSRTGCIFCCFGCHLEKEPNRFQRLKETHPKQYQYCIGGGEYVDGIWQPSKEGLGLGHVLDYIGVKY